MVQRPIGIFDSGIGGLTVLKEAMRLLPEERFVYLGDTARVPYGTKSPATVIGYAEQAAGFLVSRGVKLLVVACNTASAVALPHLAACFQLPVVGVIEPGARQAVKASSRGRIGVVGTEGTVRSMAYNKAILRANPLARVVSAACPLFVPLAEEGWAGHRVARITAEEYLEPLCREGIDTLVLGCTHYPLLKPVLSELLGTETVLVDSAAATAVAVRDLLRERNLSCRSGRGGVHFHVTDLPDRFCRVGSAFLGAELTGVEQVELGGGVQSSAVGDERLMVEAGGVV
ncbi:glutamate racemase [Geothermobacter hydrogeniphilus]|uniref:Glutamate racemase n=1 Tax=Geothermobacter hydrogeniphilus TaxID=1969733 RepID=A0A1X0Y5B0_9BACT|nr:glutamate racemase [Geothermobacter hydrogeniphilus]ORJ60333.1 glutamate racemase [Geothermobacter hydrogeniphilus]